MDGILLLLDEQQLLTCSDLLVLVLASLVELLVRRGAYDYDK